MRLSSRAEPGASSLVLAPGPRRWEAAEVDFAPSAVAQDYTDRMRAFLDEVVVPAEPV